MALEKQTHIYEVLARYDTMGRLVGCHRTDVTRIVDTDTDTVEGVSGEITVEVSAQEAADLISTATPAPASPTDVDPPPVEEQVVPPAEAAEEAPVAEEG